MSHLSPPLLGKTLIQRTRSSSLQYVRELSDSLGLWDSVPTSHQWVYDDFESLTARTAGMSPEAQVTELMWANARDVRAYCHMQVWKLYEMVSGAVHLLNNHEIVAAAAPTRSAMESSIALTNMAGRSSDLIDRLQGQPKDSLQLIRDYIGTTHAFIWGTKSDPSGVQARNILTLTKYLDKRVTDTETSEKVASVYAALCDIVHPSASGHLQWADDAGQNAGGQRMIALEFGAVGPQQTAMLDLILWALGWATMWGIRAFRVADRGATHVLTHPVVEMPA